MTTDVTLAERPPLYDGFLISDTLSEILGTDYGRLTKEIDKKQALDDPYSSPDAMRVALAYTYTTILTSVVWPTDETGHRNVTINGFEAEMFSTIVSKKSLESPDCVPIWSLYDLYEDEPHLKIADEDAFVTSEDLMDKERFSGFLQECTQQEAEDSTGQWPWHLLNFFSYLNLSESDDIEQIKEFRRGETGSTADQLDMAVHIIRCVYAGMRFNSGSNRIEAWKSLKEAFEANHTTWSLGFLDYQIQVSARTREDLSFDEWVLMVDLCAKAFDLDEWEFGEASFDWEITGRSTDAPLVGAPVQSSIHWALRFGFTASLGAHLIPELIPECINRSKQWDEDLDNSLFNDSPGLAAAADLLLSIGEDRDWPLLASTYADIYSMTLQGGWLDSDRVDQFADISVLNPCFWLIRFGYAAGMVARTSKAVQEETSALDTLHSALSPMPYGVSLAIQEQVGELGNTVDTLKDMLEGMAIRNLRHHHEIMSTINQNQDQIIETVSDRLPLTAKQLRQVIRDEMGETWTIIPNPVKSALIKAERLSRTGTDDDDAKIWFSKSVEAVLQKQLADPLVQFMIKYRHKTATIWFRGKRGVQSQSREDLESITLSAWAGVFDRTSKAPEADHESSGARYLRGFLFEQFGEGAVDKAAGLSSDLWEVQRLRNSSAHYRSDTTSEGLDDLRKLIIGNDGGGLISKIMEVFPAKK